MNKPLEVFFDYACPYCYRAHEYLKKLLPEYPCLEITWRPCEAHPRPDRYGPHSDLCIRGLFYCIDHGADVWTYHDLMYKAIHQERIDIEDLNVLAKYAGKILDSEDFRQVLQKGKYIEKLSEANRYAWEQLNLPAVPSYRMGKLKLYSAEDIGVTREQLRKLIYRGLNDHG